MYRSTWANFPYPSPGQTGWMWTQETPQLSDAKSDCRPLPRITIVTPSYNQGRFLETTIRSVLLQGYPNLEYIIIDGGSSDNSVEIIQKYEPWVAYWVSEEDRGQAHAINKGLARATGDIYAYINSDDFYEPGALQACALAFRTGRKWIVGRVRCWQEGAGNWPFPELPGKSFTKWFLSCPIPQAGCFWSADLHREMGPFREDLNYIIDYEFWLRFRFIKKIKPFIIDQPMAVYRLHSQSKTVAQNSEFIREGVPVREEYKQYLTAIQRGWLWAACRHRRARVRGTKAVAFLKRGQFHAAMRHLMSALAVWPLAVIDLHGIFLAFKTLTNRKQDGPANPDIWPKWDD
ncbi:glycosyltransferase family 2 protein [Thermodesulfobacteriota bacterium]